MTALPFTSSVPLARRQFLARRGRTIAGIVGIAVAFLLVLALKAIFAGMEERLTAFIDATGADVIVAQEGVTTMHMTQSALPQELVAAVAGVRGVAAVEGIVYKAAFVETGTDGKSGTLHSSGRAARASPPDTRLSREIGGPGVADRLGVQAGDGVRILGTLLDVSGEVSGTASITGSYAFVGRGTMERVLGAPAVLSYLLVYARPGVGGDELATRINGQIPADGVDT
jgi:putative ABC transport system permease protein